MKQRLVMLFVFGLCCASTKNGAAQTAPNPNYEEAKVPNYTLPDPLLLPDGKRVSTVTGWEQTQRPHLLRLFAATVYGAMPPKLEDQFFKIRSVDSAALNGKAIRKQITIYFTRRDTTASMDVLLYLPKNVRKAVPVFMGLNFAGNQTIHPDTGIFLTIRWVAADASYKSQNNKATEASRGIQARRWPVEELLEKGYGLATAYYGDLEPDHPNGWQSGIRSSLQSALQTRPEEWGAISAWAWGLSRMMDYLEREPAVNAKQVIVTGHSRLGKAALWAAANDRRFALIIANESGEGGAALARRWYGETIEALNTTFPHWFAPAYGKYNKHPEALPVDQHMLLALLAPRPLHIASAADDQWADPKGEFLGAKHAGAVYGLYGRKGLGASQMPEVNQPVGATVRYHVRSGKHDMLPYDWHHFIRFADGYFKK